LLVPVVLQIPKLSKLLNLLLNKSNLWIGDWLEVEDLKTSLHLLLVSSEFSSRNGVLIQFLEGFCVVHVLVPNLWSVLDEAIFVVNALFFKVLNGVLNLCLQGLVAFVDDGVSLLKAVLELLPSIIKSLKFLLVFLTELVGTKICILLLNVDELPLDRISLGVQDSELLLGGLEQVFVLLEHSKLSWRGLQDGDCILKLVQKIVQIIL